MLGESGDQPWPSWRAKKGIPQEVRQPYKQLPGIGQAIPWNQDGPSGQSLGRCPPHGHQDVDPHWIPFASIPCKSGSSVLRYTDLPEGSGNTSSLDGVLFGSTQTVNLPPRS